MSSIHLYADDASEPNAVAVSTILATIGAAAKAAVVSIVAVVERRRTQRFIARLPDHLLADFGYERDWDGTIRARREDA